MAIFFYIFSRFVATLAGHSNWVRCANYSSNERTVVSCSDDKTVRLWDTGSNKQIHMFNEITGKFPEQITYCVTS